MNSRVFVVNEPVLKRDGETIRHLDLTDAERYGKLLHLTPPGSPLTIADVIVSGFSTSLADFGPNDYLLAVGHPAMIAWAAAIAARNAGGRIRVLAWTGRGSEGRYVPTDVVLWEEERERVA
jgi:hypothetical protein